jgi:hypothetical protein
VTIIKLAVRSRQGHIFSMIRPTSIEALAGFRIHVTFADGVEGVIDLSGDVGRGVFAPLGDEAFFRTVHIGRYGQIAWSEDIEICSDSAYEEIIAKAAIGVPNA